MGCNLSMKIESLSQVQNEVPREQLGRLRPCAGAARRHYSMDLAGEEAQLPSTRSFRVVASWKPAPSGRRGAQRKYSDLAIETALTLRVVFKFPLRLTEGFLRSVLSLMDVDLEAPDHTTVSRRSQQLDLALNHVPANQPIHLIIDSTGLSIVGQGEWAAAKYGGRGKRAWKKLHIAVDVSGSIVTEALTHGSADDAKTALDLIGEVEETISSFTGDAAYDTVAIYEAAGARRANVIVPPVKTATISRGRSALPFARDLTIMRKSCGRLGCSE
jgi:hypothetical protein